jgi:hypothetical protein
MPMIDVYAATRTFPDPRTLGVDQLETMHTVRR